MLVKKDSAYRPISSNELTESVLSLAAGLMSYGLEKGDRVGILSENRPEWAFADLAILCCGGISVPIYPTLPGKQIEYIIKDSEMEIVFVSTKSQLDKINCIRQQLPWLRKIILFDDVEDAPEWVDRWSKLQHTGSIARQTNPGMVQRRAEEIKPEDVFTLVYTSGTTGEPKGVMLTHNNLISNIESIRTFCQFGASDTTLSFLPLSHIFERMAGY
jgi:long-chain acyl-CoA synthetase